MTALELPERVRRLLYYVSVVIGGAVAVAGKVLADHASTTAWFRGLDGANGYLLAVVGAVAASHLPGKVLDPTTGTEQPMAETADPDPATAPASSLPVLDDAADSPTPNGTVPTTD